MSLPGAWKRLRRGAEQDFKILTIREDQFEHPRTFESHPRVIIESTDWVNVIPVTREGQVVLIRQFRAGTGQTTLEIPGGMVEPGEDPSRAAARELEEETGFRASRVAALGEVHPNPAIQTNRCFLYLATGCERVHQGSLDVGEDISVELVDRSRLPALFREGEITHALVVAAFFYERLYREG